MRRDNKSAGIEKAGTDGGVVRGGGMLQLIEQHPTGDASEAGEALRFLICFVRGLIRENPSSDILFFAISTAIDQSNVTEEQAKSFVAWVMDQQNRSHWPKGFFA